MPPVEAYVPFVLIPFIGWGVRRRLIARNDWGRVKRATFWIGITSFMLTELARSFYRPWVYANDVDDWVVADTIGNSLGTMTAIFMVVTLAGRGSGRDWRLFALVIAGLVGYEATNLTGHHQFDRNDVIATLIFGALSGGIYALILLRHATKRGDVRLRPERPTDREAVRRVNEAAFEQEAEADLVEALHTAGATVVALVAETDSDIVGHCLFSRVTVERGEANVAGLAPMAVLPAHQRSGIGTQLVEAGLEECSRLGFSGVVVLGHPDYYPRFGFEPATRLGLRSEYDVPSDVFMAKELREGGLSEASGLVRYHPAFAGL